MGRLAKLNAAGLLRHKSKHLIVAIKHDASYEVEKDIAGEKIKEKVENYCYVPLGTSSLYVSPFKSMDEANVFLKVLANTSMSADQQKVMFAQKFKILEVKNPPLKKGMLDMAWAKKNVVNEIDVDIEKKKSSQLL